MTKDFSFGVVPFFREKDRVLYLLIQHQVGHWALPKGHSEEGEEPRQTALRELAEETGISSCTLLPGFESEEHYTFTRDGIETDKTVIFYLGEVSDRRVALQEVEVKDAAWLPYEEAIEKMTYPATADVLREANAYLLNQPS